jgi:hypothetical protein
MLETSPVSSAVLMAAFAGGGLLLAWLWYRWRDIPHHLDMAFGMLSLGNLGMLLGWWGDLFFEPFPGCPACCSNPWGSWGMWIGMFVAANLAMSLLARRNYSSSWQQWLGCNLGMGIGMLAGGTLITSTPAGHFVGMDLGMLLGMAIGHEILPALWSTRRAANESSLCSL